MGHFPEAGQEADSLAAQLAMNSQLAEGEETQAQNDAGSDDAGGADTPLDAQVLTGANSDKIEINSGGAQGTPQILETVLKPIMAERISDLLIANGFTEESARGRSRAPRASSPTCRPYRRVTSLWRLALSTPPVTIAPNRSPSLRVASTSEPSLWAKAAHMATRPSQIFRPS